TTRRVVAVQNGEAIFNMDVSFQVAEPGFDHAHPMPNVPMADELNDDVSLARSLISTHKGSQLKTIAENPRPFETRSVFAVGSQAWGKDRFWSPTWIKFRQQLDPTNTKLARCLLAYASDMSVVSTASLPHQSVAARKDIQMASLDHALWIHRSVPINEWILFHKRTSTSQGARGLVHAEFFSQQGILIASVTQEGLLRTPAVSG
ncbi:MAG: acyl-CoA thioesterase II, partial [Gammaproteobacteria bacterium]|nr:acyl-CoA thioesterase II [Gammaproteobacteria bacterium]